MTRNPDRCPTHPGEILREDVHPAVGLPKADIARRLGIGGVPCFIVDGKYALSGAQEPEAFLPILDMALQERSGESIGASE